jgi:TrmH family RNA methyltransferase
MITSFSNPRLKTVRELLKSKKKRDQANAFVVEGIRLAEEALAADYTPSLVLYSQQISERGQQLLSRLDTKQARIEEVDTKVLDRVSATETSQGLLMVCEKPGQSGSLSSEPLLVLDQMRDPGNLGTILRGACAFGFQSVLLTPGSADPYSPKALRAGMGAQFKLPVLFQDASEIRKTCKNRPAGPLNILLADAQAQETCWQKDLSRPLCLIIGGEAFGAEPEIRNIIDEGVLIPMQTNNESLNAAMAASILMYEVYRQRKRK